MKQLNTFSLVSCVALALFQTQVFAQETKAVQPLKQIASASPAKTDGCTRFATFNVSFHRKAEGQLAAELKTGNRIQPRRVAEILQTVRPDVVLLNEFDYDKDGAGIQAFQERFLDVSQNGKPTIKYPHIYFAPVNTGLDSGLDLNGDGKTGSPNDAFGFGNFEGQYGMMVLSMHPIDTANVRSFQKFLWRDMPNNLMPKKVGSDAPYYPKDVEKIFRLSSKSHWDVPIKIDDKTVHFLVSHPTPPVFDEDEDRNGRRNHDEIRLWADFVTPGKADYLVDDKGNKGGLPTGSHFIIAGDQNSDPSDGSSREGAAAQLTMHPLINNETTPASSGGSFYAKLQGFVNKNHKGDPSHDTSDFRDNVVGNLRLDYCLPAKTLKLQASGVFWPRADEADADLVRASDHRLVWIDVK